MQVDVRNPVLRRIAEGVKGHGRGKFTKRHAERFLYTFANEVGCDFPSEEIVKLIFGLLTEEESKVNAERFEKFIEVCLKIQEDSFKTPIGGIF